MTLNAAGVTIGERPARTARPGWRAPGRQLAEEPGLADAAFTDEQHTADSAERAARTAARRSSSSASRPTTTAALAEEIAARGHDLSLMRRLALVVPRMSARGAREQHPPMAFEE